MLKTNLVPVTDNLDNYVVLNGDRVLCDDALAKKIFDLLSKGLEGGTAKFDTTLRVKPEVAEAVVSTKSTSTGKSTSSKKKSGEPSKFESAGGRAKYEQVAAKLGVLVESKNGNRKVGGANAKEKRDLVYAVMYGEMTLTAAKAAVKRIGA